MTRSPLKAVSAAALVTFVLMGPTRQSLAEDLVIQSQFYMDLLGDEFEFLPAVPSPLRDIIGGENGYTLEIHDVTYTFEDDIQGPTSIAHAGSWSFTFTGEDADYLNSHFQFTRGAVDGPSASDALFRVTETGFGATLYLYLWETADPDNDYTETLEVYVHLPPGTVAVNDDGYPVVAPFAFTDPQPEFPTIRTILRDFFDPTGLPAGIGNYYYVSNENPGGSEVWPDTFVVRPPTSGEQVEDILDFIDSSEDSGNLSGTGPGNSGSHRLDALANMIAAAGALLEEGDLAGACDQLAAAYAKCDGVSPPPDFVTGAARDELAASILDLMDSTGCE